MTTTLTRDDSPHFAAPPPPPPTPASRRLSGPLLGLIALLAVVALNAGWQLATGGSRYAVALPIAAVAGIALAALALTRFESFIVVAIAIRATLDWSRGGESAPGGGGSGPGAAALALLVIVVGGLWLLAWHRQRPRHDVTPLEVAMTLFLGTAAVSVIGSARPVTSSLELARLAGVLVMFLVMRRILCSSAQWTDRLLTAAFLSALIPIAAAAVQALSGGGVLHAGGFARVRGTFVHPNPFAFYLTLVIIMGTALLTHLRGWRQVGLLGILGGSTVCLLLTYTRTAWLAVVVGLVIVGVLQSRWLLGVLVAGLVLLLVAVPSVGGRFADLSQQEHLSGTAGNSLVWRFDYWKDALTLASKQPLTGIGLKMTESTEGRQPHNDFVRAYAETGIIGFAAYLGLLFAVIRTAWRAVRTSARGRDRGIAVGFAGCAAALPLVSFTSNVMSQAVILWYFFAFAAAAISVSGSRRLRSTE